MSDETMRSAGGAAIGLDDGDLLSERHGHDLPSRATTAGGFANWKTWIVLLLMFAAGGAVGSAITLSVVNQRWRQFADHPERMPERILRELQEQLRPDAAQAEQIEAIVNERHRDFERIRAEIHPRASANLDRMEREIAAVLRDDQRPAWEAWVAEKRTRFPAPPKDTAPADPSVSPPNGSGDESR